VRLKSARPWCQRGEAEVVLERQDIGRSSYQVHNSCDIAGVCPNSEMIISQVATLGGNPDVDVIINSLKQQVGFCDPLCGTDPNGTSSSLPGVSVGTLNHFQWPLTWTEPMLDFLATHP
jgi:hypothetical protein